MTGPVVIQVDDLWKEYRLGSINHGTLKADLASWWARKLGREDPNVKLNQVDQSGEDEKAPDRFWALQEVSLEVRQGEVLGIIGGNGAGKSTLLKILSRVTTPTRGTIKAKGRVASLLEVGTGFHPELTGRENVFLNGAILGMRREEIARKLDEIVDFAGVGKFVDTPVKRYSSGMYVRLAFAVAAHLEPDILVIDEVLAVGDAEFQRRCLGKMDEVSKGGRTILFVSHNLAAVQRLCGRSLWMRNGRAVDVGPSVDLIPRYLQQQNAGLAHGQITPGLLFVQPTADQASEIWVNRVEMLAQSGVMKCELHTWDPVRFRVGFSSRRRFISMSVVIQVSTVDGTVILLTSTTPDRTRSFAVEAGSFAIDCDFPEFPLASGEYVLGVGLAIPGVEYVWRKEDLCRIEVGSRDVYQSGLAPFASRYIVASQHDWSELRPIEETLIQTSHAA
jgi:lipopolysaccharide transport system ATP-binding protein